MKQKNIIILLIAMALIIAGIVLMTSDNQKVLLSDLDQASVCQENGGKWIPVGKAQIPDCIYTYSDGGQECSSSSDCEGRCIVTEVDGSDPHCAFDSDIFGCQSSIEDFEEYGGILCID